MNLMLNLFEIGSTMATHGIFVQWKVMRVASDSRMLLLTHNIWCCSRHSILFLFILFYPFHPFICNIWVDERESFQLRLVGRIFALAYFFIPVYLELTLYENRIMPCVSWEKTGPVSFFPETSHQAAMLCHWLKIVCSYMHAFDDIVLFVFQTGFGINERRKIGNHIEAGVAYFDLMGETIWMHLHGIFN